MSRKQLYGWLGFQPRFLQFLNNHVSFACCATALAFVQCIFVVGIWSTNLSTIEKRYGFSSTQAALLGSIFDFSYGILGVLVGFFWTKNKPKKIATGSAILLAGFLIFTIPQYISEAYKGGVLVETDWCVANSTSNATLPGCHQSQGSPWYYFFLFCIGCAVAGIGSTPTWTLAPAHIEDVSPPSRTSLYLSMLYGACAVGPAVGFIMGERILRIYVDIKQPEGSNLRPEDRNFVGAWWIGYLASGALLLPTIIMMAGFPEDFPDTEKLKREKLLEVHDVAGELTANNNLQDIVPATKTLVTNKSFLCINMMAAALCWIMGGVGTFTPKLLETQFHISSADASIYTGYVTIPSAVFGYLLGGFLMRVWAKSCKQMFSLLIGLMVLVNISALAFFIGCGTRQIVGVQVPYHGSEGAPQLDEACRGSCSCLMASYKPICTVADRLTYYSPCHAGCMQNNIVGESFYNCSCFPPGVSEASSDRCYPQCNLLPWFSLGLCLHMVFAAAAVVPVLKLTFRIVPDNLGSFAMGLQQMVLRLLGFVPAPLLYGALTDKACVLWGKDACGGGRTSCYEYDNQMFRYYFFGLTLGASLLALLFTVLGKMLYKLSCLTSLCPTDIFDANLPTEMQIYQGKEAEQTYL